MRAEIADSGLEIRLEQRQLQHHPRPSPPLEGEGVMGARFRMSWAEAVLIVVRCRATPPLKPSPSRGGLGGDGFPILQSRFSNPGFQGAH